MTSVNKQIVLITLELVQQRTPPIKVIPVASTEASGEGAHASVLHRETGDAKKPSIQSRRVNWSFPVGRCVARATRFVLRHRRPRSSTPTQSRFTARFAIQINY